MNGVPVDFQVGSYSHAALSAGAKDIGQIEKNCFLPAGRKAQIVLRRNPATVAIWNFQAQPVSAPAAALGDGHIHRRLCVVDRPLCDQVEGAAFRSIVAEVHFKIMIPRYTLILAASKAGKGLSVERANDVGNVLACVVDGPDNFMRRRNGREAQLQRRNYETLIDKNLRAHRVVDGHERQIVVVINLPQLRRDPQVVVAVVRHELVAANLVPLAGRRDLRRTKSINAQADRRAPGNCVLYKLHLLSVVSEEERTGSLQALLGHDVRVGFHPKFGAYGSIRPDYLHDVRLGLLSQSEMKLRTGDGLLLHQQAGPNFNFASDSERVDTLVAHGLHGVRPDDLPVIILRSLILRLEGSSVGGKA